MDTETDSGMSRRKRCRGCGRPVTNNKRLTEEERQNLCFVEDSTDCLKIQLADKSAALATALRERDEAETALSQYADERERLKRCLRAVHQNTGCWWKPEVKETDHE